MLVEEVDYLKPTVCNVSCRDNNNNSKLIECLFEKGNTLGQIKNILEFYILRIEEIM